MKVSKHCIGCPSNRTAHDYCGLYLNLRYTPPEQRRIFRERFCPCVKCLVKATCKDPKIEILVIQDKLVGHKCQLMKDQIKAFHNRRTYENKSKRSNKKDTTDTKKV